MKRLFAVPIAVCFAAFALPAHAWFFFFLPIGAISDALEADPDKATFSAKDRHYSKCAGYHLNQIMVTSKPAEQTEFHRATAARTVAASQDKEQVQKIGEVYSRRWSKAVRVDMQTNLSFGADLGRSCREVSIPISLAEQEALQAREKEARERAAAEAQRVQQEAIEKAAEAQRAQQEAAKAAAQQSAPEDLTEAPTSKGSLAQIDFGAEATKASRILGCTPQLLKVVGAENRNVLYDVACSGGTALRLACDPTGLCLNR
jgi:hypothetical protein